MAVSSVTPSPKVPSLLPGLALCLLVTAVAYGLESLEHTLFGRAWLEALVIAIIIGTALRSFWQPGANWHNGVAFGAKYPLEVAIVLLGASMSIDMVLHGGPALLIGIAVLVASAIALSFGLGRLFGLPPRMALLVACGNSICGNSAIAAVAPVINAESDDVAASIAFTAVLGVVVVLVLPLLGLALGMSPVAYGAFAGLTVYAVPQVLAATAPIGAAAVQMGTLVKLIRVLMLGPVCLVLSLIAPKLTSQQYRNGSIAEGTAQRSPRLVQLVPWFIIGFLAMMLLRSLGLLPELLISPIRNSATILTVFSMAALGLGVDLRAVTKASGRVIATVVLSLVMLAAISLAFLALVPVS